MGITDNVAEYILNMLKEADGIAEIQRNELASTLGCVPSQINYVITSRFTPEQGYVVESKRGGGGYIRITRSIVGKTATIMHIINSVGNSLDTASASAILKNMVYSKVITSNEAYVIASVVSNRTLVDVPNNVKDNVRASIFKNILLAMRSE